MPVPSQATVETVGGDIKRSIEEPQVIDFQAGSVAAVAAGHTINDTTAAFLSPMLPLLIETLSIGKAQAGLLSVFTQAPSLLQPVIGHIAGRKGLRIVVILAPAVTATLMSFLGLAPNYLVLAFLLLLVGFSSASLHATGPVLAGNLSGSRLGRGMSYWMVGGEIGRALGPMIIVTALNYVSLRGTAWLALLGLAASVMLYFRLRNVPELPQEVNRAEPFWKGVRQMGPLMLPLAGFILLRAFLAFGMPVFLPTYLTEAGDSLWLAGMALTIMEIPGVIGAFIGGSISDRIGRRPVLLLTQLLAPLLMLLFLQINMGARLALLLVYGFIQLSAMPVIMAMVQEQYPENRALANGVFMAVNFACQAIASLTVGILGQAFNLGTAFTVSALLSLFALPIVFFLPKDR